MIAQFGSSERRPPHATPRGSQRIRSGIVRGLWVAASVFAIGCLLASTARAAGDPSYRYVRTGATGNNSGLDWTNAHTQLPDDLVRGFTYWLADGTYEGKTWETPVSGVQRITIKKAVATEHGADTGWSNTYGDGVAQLDAMRFVTSYYTLDGTTGGGLGSWDSGHGIRITGGENDTVFSLGKTQTDPPFQQPIGVQLKHLDIGGMPGAKVYRTMYSWGGGEGLGARDLTIQHCYIHDVLRSIVFGMFGKNWLLEYNYITRNTSSPEHHGSGFADRGTDDVIIRYNYWADLAGTAYIDIKKNEDQQHDNWQIYGNVFFVHDGNPHGVGGIGGNGSIGMTSTDFAQSNNFKVFNNTFINVKGLNTGIYFPIGSGNEVYNNIWLNCDQVSHINVTHDYNTYINTPFAWTTEAAPHDVVLASGNPFVDWPNGNFRLAAAMGDAKADIGAPFRVDMLSNVRGADGVWDRGALEFGGVQDSEAPSAPAGLQASAAAHDRIDLTWTAATDNVAVAGYRVYRAGAEIGTTANTTYQSTGLTPSTPYSYQVRAYDGSGNQSGLSTVASATTLAPPPPQISIADASATEGNSGSTNMTFNLTLTSNPGQVVTVNYATANGTALAGVDYAAGSGSVIFAAGQLTQTLTVAVTGDTDEEANETFTVNLSSPSAGVTLADGQAEGSIQDDDAPAGANLEGQWRCDEGSGTSAADGSGNGHNGTLSGATWAAGHEGTAIAFDGVDDSVDLGTSQFNCGPQITVVFWVYATGSGTGFQSLVGRGQYIRPFRIRLDKDTHKIETGLRTSAGTSYLTSIGSIGVDEWHHVALTYQSGTRVIYIDGVADVSNSHTGDLGSYSEPTSLGALEGAGFFSGRLDDVRIYSRALSAAEIEAIHAGGGSPPPSDTTAPSVPGGLAATAASSTQINLSWAASADNVGVTGYRIHRAGALLTTVTGTSYQDASLSPSTQYSYQVAAYDAANNASALCAARSATTQDPGAGGAGFFVAPNGNDANPGTEAQPWLTLQKAATTADAGDTINIKAGTYTGRVRPTKSGTSAAPIVFQKYGAGTVIVTTPANEYAFDLRGFEYIVVAGITMRDCYAFVYLDAANHNTVRNCTMDGARTYHCLKIDNGSYNKIIDCDFVRGIPIAPGSDGYTPANLADYINIWRDSHYNLIEGCNFGAIAHAAIHIQGREAQYVASHNIVRNCTFTDNHWKAIGIHHTELTLVENCTFSGNAADFIQFEGPKVIMRRNRFYGYRDTTGGRPNTYMRGAIRLWSTNDLYGLPGRAQDNRLYHNVFYGNEKSITSYHSSLDYPVNNNVLKNNIFFNNGAPLELYYPDYTSTNQNFFNANVLRGTAAGQDVVRLYNAGFTVAGAQAQLTQHYRDNLDVDPGFVNAAGADFQLAVGSPCIDAGNHLTQTVNAGSGTQLSVLDSSYFMDGWTIVDGDQIQVGANSPARIVAIDYAANRITIDRSITWNNGDGVSLPYNGSAPDIGAFESGQAGGGDTTAPSVPQGLAAQAAGQTQVNLTWSASTDNVGVTRYRVFRDGAQIATATGTSYADNGLSPGTPYSYCVCADDAAGNSSAQSSPVSVTPPVAPVLSIANVSVTEGTGGSTNATFTVTLSPAANNTVTVSWATANGTATAADFTAGSGSLVFAPQATQNQITVAIATDGNDEPDETFTVNLSNPNNAAIGVAQATGTIRDDDGPAPDPALSVGDASVTEGNSGTTNASFTVTLSAASQQTVTVDYATADGTATVVDADYAPATGALTFSAGQTTKQIVVVVSGDTVYEGDETFNLILSNPTNATLPDGQATGTIEDDDASAPEGLFGHWAFDETAGTVAQDGTTFANDGALQGGATWAAGKVSGAVAFDGIDDTVALGASQFGISTDFSAACWVYVNGDGGAEGQVLVSRGLYMHPFRLRLNGHKLEVGTRTGDGASYLTSSANLEWRRWHHVALTYAPGVRRIYLDGQLDNSDAPSGALRGDYLTDVTSVGGAEGAQFLNGALDDLRIFNRALDAAEVQGLYDLGQDSDAPAAPRSLSATAASHTEIDVSWWASTDNVAVTGYKVYRNGSEVATVTDTSYHDAGREPSSTFTYEVSAYDAANNESVHSQPAFGTTNPLPPQPPSFTGAALTPATAYETSVLSVQCTGWSDPNGDSEGYHFQWNKNGSAIAGATGASLTGAHFNKGDSVSCTVTAWDGAGEGNTIETAPVVIQNTVPSFDSADLPAGPHYKSSVLTVVCSGWQDADGDPESYQFQWKKDGASIPGATGATLRGLFAKGNSISCVATAWDGSTAGASVESSLRFIADGAPSFTGATVVPAAPTKSSTLAVSCAGWQDPDGDAETYDYQWKNNAAPVSGAKAAGLTSVYFNKGDSVTCQVTPMSGTTRGETRDTPAVVVGNSAPTFTGCAITPNPASDEANLNVGCAGWSDLDGDAEGYTYQWLKNSAELTGATQATLSSGQFSGGDVISCRVTAWDGAAAGNAHTAAPVTIVSGNVSPSFTGAAITPAAPFEADELAVICSGWSDGDGDPEGYRYQWRKNGSDIPGATTARLPAAQTAENNVILCVVTAWDGQLAGTPIETAAVTVRRRVTVSVSQLRKYLLGRTTLSAEQLAAADLNDDGQVNLADLVLLIRRQRGQEEEQTEPDPAERSAGTEDSYASIVNRLFLDLLGREPDDGGRQYFTSRLTNGEQSLGQVARQLINSPEFAEGMGFVLRCYFGLLNDNSAVAMSDPAYRLPDKDGVRYWMEQAVGSEGRLSVVRGMMAAPEFTARASGVDDAQFVTLLYCGVLGREPESNALTQYAGYLAAGTLTREQLALNILASEEALNKYANPTLVAAAHLALLDRVMSRAEFNGGSETLAAAGADPAVYLQGVIATEECARRMAGLGCPLPALAAPETAAAPPADEDSAFNFVVLSAAGALEQISAAMLPGDAESQAVFQVYEVKPDLASGRRVYSSEPQTVAAGETRVASPPVGLTLEMGRTYAIGSKWTGPMRIDPDAATAAAQATASGLLGAESGDDAQFVNVASATVFPISLQFR